jgi:hypothetical protein
MKKDQPHPTRSKVDQELINALMSALYQMLELTIAQDDLIKTLTGEPMTDRSKAINKMRKLMEKNNAKRPTR